MATREVALTAAPRLGSPAPDRLLLASCRAGDAEAFARLVALHERMVFSLAARLLGDGEEARDIAQDVFLQVYRTIGTFQERCALRTWIYRIVVNLCRNRRRFWMRRRRERQVPLEDMTAADEARAGDGRGALDPHAELLRRERAARVQEALLALSFDHRAILLLKEVEGLPCDEIASALGVAEGTVKSRLARAREALRGALSGSRSALEQP